MQQMNRSYTQSIFRSYFYLIITGLTLCCLHACGDSEGESNTGGEPMANEMDMMTVIGRGGTDTVDPNAGTDGTGGEGQKFLSYTRLILNGSDVQGDLIVFDPMQNAEVIINEGIARDELDCITRGCTLHPNLTWVGWMQKVENKNSLWIAPVSGRSVDIAQKRKLSDDAITYEFTDDLIVYSEYKDRNAADGVSVKYEPIDGSSDAFEFALTNNSGGFSSTMLGEIFIVLQTTLSTMNISFYSRTEDRTVNLFTFGEAGQTGSEFSATQNPVILAPDLSYLIAVTNNDLTWRFHNLAVEDAIVEPVSRDLFPTRNAPERCQGNLAFTQVVGKPIFTKDSESFYILFSGDCSGGNRLDYDIYRFNKDMSSEPVNITQLPPVNHWSKHEISFFSLSVDEKQIAFVAKRPNQQDSESIWVINVPEGGAKPDFDCSRSDGQNDLEGITRCEYLWYEGGEGTSKYKSLQYHQTGAF